MDIVETQVLIEDWDVDRRLSELDLNRAKLLEVVNVAVSASADSTPFHPANAAGTLAYQYGTWSLRDQLVGKRWQIDRSDSVEAIRNNRANVKVVYSNVDIACNKDHGPKPRSRKGAGSERVCNGQLFDDLPQYAPTQDDKYATYFLMVDVNGAAELSRPVISSSGTYSSYIERITSSDGNNELALLIRLSIDDEHVADEFDPK